MNNSFSYNGGSTKGSFATPDRNSILSPTKYSAMLVLNTQTSNGQSVFSPTPEKRSLEILDKNALSAAKIQNSNPLLQPKINIVTDQSQLPKVASYSKSLPSHYTEVANWEAYKQVKDQSRYNNNFSEENFFYKTPTKATGRAVNSYNESKSVDKWRVEKNDSTSLGGDNFFSPLQSDRKSYGSEAPPIEFAGTSFIYNPSPSHNLPGASGGPGPGFGFTSPKVHRHLPFNSPSPHHKGKPIFATARPEHVSLPLQLPGLLRDELAPRVESPLVSDKLARMAQVSGSAPIPNPTFRTAGGRLPPQQEIRRVINKKNVPAGQPKLLPGESVELLKQREREREEKLLRKKQEEEEAISRLEGLSSWHSPVKQRPALLPSGSEAADDQGSDADATYLLDSGGAEAGEAPGYPIYSKDEAAAVVVSDEVPHVALNEVWSKCWDHEACCAYYYNNETGEATWIIPDDF